MVLAVVVRVASWVRIESTLMESSSRRSEFVGAMGGENQGK